MSDKHFALYSRGFAGSEKNATKTVLTKNSKQLLSFFDHGREETEYSVSNEQIVQAYNQLMRRQVVSTDFDWRERVIKSVLRAFGTLSTSDWISACERSPTFSQNHAECIEDWLQFCMTGKRKLNPVMWERLISPGVNDPSLPARVSKQLTDALPAGYSHILRAGTGRNNLPNLIAKGLERPGGFSDLVITCYTFFGDNNL